MSNAIDKLRKHFNSKAVPNSKALKEERDTVNALIDAVDEENAKLRETIADIHEALCADRIGMFHNLIVSSMEDDMRELGIEF